MIAPPGAAMTEAGDGRGAAAYRPAGRRRQLAEHCADLEPLRRVGS